MGLKYPAWFMNDEDESIKVITVQFFDIPNCIAEGNNKQEAIVEAIDVLKSDVLEFNYFRQDKPVPLPSPIEDVPPYRENFGCSFPVDLIELPEALSCQILEYNKRCANQEK